MGVLLTYPLTFSFPHHQIHGPFSSCGHWECPKGLPHGETLAVGWTLDGWLPIVPWGGLHAIKDNLISKWRLCRAIQRTRHHHQRQQANKRRINCPSGHQERRRNWTGGRQEGRKGVTRVSLWRAIDGSSDSVPCTRGGG